MNKSIADFQLYKVSPTYQTAQIRLASGIAFENPIELIKRFYSADGHVLYDLLPVAKDNCLDPACLIAPAFFTSFNTRFDEWRSVWQSKSLLEEPLQRIQCRLSLSESEETIPWLAIKDIFAKFLDLKGFRISRVSKILHKKRPHLIPILDERIVRHYYKSDIDTWIKMVAFGRAQLQTRGKAHTEKDALKSEDVALELIKSIRKDLILNLELLKSIQTELKPYLDLSLVRLLDLILWQSAGSNRKKAGR
jgi:hypothetical protein